TQAWRRAWRRSYARAGRAIAVRYHFTFRSRVRSRYAVRAGKLDADPRVRAVGRDARLAVDRTSLFRREECQHGRGDAAHQSPERPAARRSRTEGVHGRPASLGDPHSALTASGKGVGT